MSFGGATLSTAYQVPVAMQVTTVVGNNSGYVPSHTKVPHIIATSGKFLSDWVYKDISYNANGNLLYKRKHSQFFVDITKRDTRCYRCLDDSTTLEGRLLGDTEYLYCNKCDAMQHFAVGCDHPDCADAPLYGTETIDGGTKPETIARLCAWFCCKRHQNATTRVSLVWREDDEDETEVPLAFTARIGASGRELLQTAVDSLKLQYTVDELSLVKADSPREVPVLVASDNYVLTAPLIEIAPNCLTTGSASFCIMTRAEISARRSLPCLPRNMAMELDGTAGRSSSLGTVVVELKKVPHVSTAIPPALMEAMTKKKKKKKRMRAQEQKRKRNTAPPTIALDKKHRQEPIKPAVDRLALAEWMHQFGYDKKTPPPASDMEPRHLKRDNGHECPADNYVMIVLSEDDCNACRAQLTQEGVLRWLSPLRRRTGTYNLYYLVIPFGRGQTGHLAADKWSTEYWNNMHLKVPDLQLLRAALESQFSVDVSPETTPICVPPPPLMEMPLLPPYHLPLTQQQQQHDGRMRLVKSMPMLSWNGDGGPLGGLDELFGGNNLLDTGLDNSVWGFGFGN